MYEGDVWEPLAVWLLGGFEDAHERRLSFNQFMLQDGRTYRTYEAHERLHAICTRLGNPELTDGAFSENHAASTIGKEKKERLEANLSQPPPRHSEGLCRAGTQVGDSTDYDTRVVVLLSGIFSGHG